MCGYAYTEHSLEVIIELTHHYGVLIPYPCLPGGARSDDQGPLEAFYTPGRGSEAWLALVGRQSTF